MKKIVLLFVMVCLPMFASADLVEISGYCGKDGDNIKWTYNSDKESLILEGSGEMASCNSGSPWDKYKESIKTITIGEGITAISDFAFQSAKVIEVVFPQTLEKMGAGAFRFCINLEKVIIPDAVETIGYSVFEDCTQLVEIKLSASLTEIPRDAFRQTTIKVLEVPDKVEKIGNAAFYSCKELQSVTLPEGLKEIGSHCFNECSQLSIINFPESLSMIGAYAFRACNNLESVEIIGPTTIGNCAFRECSGLSAFTFPDSFTEANFGENVFDECDKLPPLYNSTLFVYMPKQGYDTYQMPNGITTIARYAFYGNESLKTIEFPSSLKYLGSYSFAESQLEECDFSNMEDIIVSNNAFQNTPIKKISSSTSIANLFGYAFAGCKNLEEIDLSGLKKLPDVYYMDYGIYAHTFSNCISLKKIVLPHMQLEIGQNAFENCKSLEAFDFTDVTELDKFAFANCSSLKDIDLKGVIYLNDRCFQGCRGLERVVMHCVSQFFISDFEGCNNLTSIVIDSEQIPSLYDLNSMYTTYSDLAYKSFDDFNLPYGNCTFTVLGYLAQFLIDGNDGIFWRKVKFDKQYEELSGSCGDETSSITWSLNTEDGIFKVDGTGYMMNYGDGAVAPWKDRHFAIKEVQIGDGVRGIGSYAFGGCQYLRKVKYNNLQKIGDFAFCESGLTSFDFKEGLEETGTGIFRGCTSLQTVALPQTLQIIGEGLFSGCTNMQKAVLPKGLLHLPNYTFANCNNLKEIYVPAFSPPTPDPGRSCSYTFAGVTPNSVTVYVPEGTVDAYNNSVLWNRFANIKDHYAYVEISNSKGGTYTIDVTGKRSDDWSDYLEIGNNFTMKTESDDYYYLVSLLVNGIEMISQLENGVLNYPSIKQSLIIALKYEPIEYEFLLSVTGKGHISVMEYNVEISGKFNVTYEDEIEMEFVPNDNYKLDSVLQNGINITNQLVNKKYVVRNPTQNIKIDAYFSKEQIDGDMNGDGKADAHDVVGIVEALLGKSSDEFEENSVDLNNDEVINIADIVTIVNIIMGQ